MAESNRAQDGGAGGSSNRDATRARPRVQQLRPTNRDAPVPPPVVPVAAPAQSTAPDVESVEAAQEAAPSPIKKITPRIVTGQGSGSTILVNNCQVSQSSN